MPIVTLYAAILALLFVGLGARTIVLRQRLRIAIGDAGNSALLRAIRVHANFAEYVPLALLVLFFVEITAAAPWLVHALGVSLVAGRVLHALGVSRVQEPPALRVLGMVLTLMPLAVAALWLLYVFATSQRL